MVAFARWAAHQPPELFKVQGLHSAAFGDWQSAGISDANMGHMLGNAVSLNVVERIMSRALFSAGLVRRRLPDRWAPSCPPPRPWWGQDMGVAPCPLSKTIMQGAIMHCALRCSRRFSELKASQVKSGVFMLCFVIFK